MKYAVVIGAGSDIAKSAISMLEGEYFVFALSRDQLDLSQADAADKINNVLSMYNPDVVLNCAGIFGGNNISYDPMFTVNVASNWSVIDYYIKNPPDKLVKFIMLGSSVYKQGRRNHILYAASKSALYSIWQGASEFVSANFKLGIINPVHVHTKMVAHISRPDHDVCLTPDDVALKILELTHMTNHQCIDMDYKKKESL